MDKGVSEKKRRDKCQGKVQEKNKLWVRENVIGGSLWLTYDFGRPEFGGEPGVVAELALAYSAEGELLREAADGGDERGLATPAAAARNERVRLLGAARGAVARDAVPERTRQQSSSPVDGLHRALYDTDRVSRSPRARDQHQRDYWHRNAHSSSRSLFSRFVSLNWPPTIDGSYSRPDPILSLSFFYKLVVEGIVLRRAQHDRDPETYLNLSSTHHRSEIVRPSTELHGIHERVGVDDRLGARSRGALASRPIRLCL